MKTVFVDSNVFLRFFTIDQTGQHEKAAALFAGAAEGKIRLVTGPPVLFEIVWTLRSAYKLSKEQILDAVEAIAAFKGIGAERPQPGGKKPSGWPGTAVRSSPTPTLARVPMKAELKSPPLTVNTLGKWGPDCTNFKTLWHDFAFLGRLLVAALVPD